jgi:hypothetical protein
MGKIDIKGLPKNLPNINIKTDIRCACVFVVLWGVDTTHTHTHTHTCTSGAEIW